MSLLSKWRSVALALALCTTQSAASPALPAGFRALLEEYDVPRAHVGLRVESLEDGEVIASLNPDQPFNPASVIKLLSSLAALEILSPAYQWTTEVYKAGTVSEGLLNGDLYIRGGGDPYLTVESAWVMMRSVRALGIERIVGDMVVDESLFDLPPFDRGAFDHRPYRLYNGPAGALMMNFWAVRFTISALDNSVRIDAFPDSSRLRVVNRVSRSDAACDRRHRYVDYRVEQTAVSVTVTFNGVLSRHCRPIVITRAVIPPERYASYVLPGLWRDAGGVLDGGVRRGEVPVGAKRLYTQTSRTLAEAIRAMNKFSNNMMARHLLLTLGSLESSRDVRVEDGARVLRNWLLSQGIEVPGLRIVNGAGLSRETRVSATGMVNVLRAGVESRYAPEFLASFPIAGEDKALHHRRFGGGDAVVRLKTGLIDHVRAMAAYIPGADGETYAAVLLVNHRNAHRGLGTRLQDALIRHVLDR